MTDLANTGAFAVIPTKVDGIYIRPLTRTLLNKHGELFNDAVDAAEARRADDNSDDDLFSDAEYEYERYVIGEIGCDADGESFVNATDLDTFKAFKDEYPVPCKSTMDAILGAINEALGAGKG